MLPTLRALSLIPAAIAVLAVGCGNDTDGARPELPREDKLFLVGTEVEYDIVEFAQPGLRVTTDDPGVASASLVELETKALTLRIAVHAAGQTRIHLFADDQRLSGMEVHAVEFERVRVSTSGFNILGGPPDLPDDIFETDSIAVLAGSEVALAGIYGVVLEGIDPNGEAELISAAFDEPLRETDCLGADYNYVCPAFCIIRDPSCIVADEAGVHTIRAEFAGGHSLATTLRAVAPSDVVRIELLVEESNAQNVCTGKIYALGYDRDDRLIIALDPSFVLDGTTMDRAPADEEEPALWLYPSWQRSFELDPTVSADVVVTFNGIQATAPIRGIPCE